MPKHLVILGALAASGCTQQVPMGACIFNCETANATSTIKDNSAPVTGGDLAETLGSQTLEPADIP